MTMSDEISTVDTNDYVAYLTRLRSEGTRLRSDGDGQPSFMEKPAWLNEAQLADAKRLWNEHFMGINFAHLSGLLLLVRVDSIHRTLKSTGKSDSCAKLFKRYFGTLKHVQKWYEGDLLTAGSEALTSLQIVRGMHNKISSQFNDNKKGYGNNNEQSCPMMPAKKQNEDQNKGDVVAANPSGADSTEKHCCIKITNNDQAKHISQYDLMITQYAFVGFIVTHPKCVGLLDKFTREDLDSILHFWRVIGHYLGIKGEYNLCSYKTEDVIGLCKALHELEYKQAIMQRNILESEHGLMSLNIARSVKFIPMITFYAMMKHSYKMLEIDSEDLEAHRTCYTSWSYYIIDMIMCRHLAYKPLRAFNNGLIRLSIYIVGRYEDWFSNHLELSHGPTLMP